MKAAINALIVLVCVEFVVCTPGLGESEHQRSQHALERALGSNEGNARDLEGFRGNRWSKPSSPRSLSLPPRLSLACDADDGIPRAAFSAWGAAAKAAAAAQQQQQQAGARAANSMRAGASMQQQQQQDYTGLEEGTAHRYLNLTKVCVRVHLHVPLRCARIDMCAL